MTERVRETTGDVAAAVRQMYASLGDPAGFDRFLHPEITIWESDQPGPRFGLPELDALRNRRSAGSSSAPPALTVEELLVDRWGGSSAVARYVLSAHLPGHVEQFRVTDVWHGEPDGWRIVHHHAEALADPAAGAGNNGSTADASSADRQGDEDLHAG